jgi:hypothetical protein
VEKCGRENVLIVVGLNQPFSCRVIAETFMNGDPTGAGIEALGVRTYHILELKDFIPEETWQEQMGMKELELELNGVDMESALRTLRECRGE